MRLRSIAGSILRRLLGHQRLVLLHETHAPGWQAFVRLLERHGVQVATIFDIGVASGTPELYAAWPAAKLYLFDPSAAALPHMQAIARTRPAEIFNVALSDRAGAIDFYERPGDHAGSSMLAAQGGRHAIARTVATDRFDALVTDIERPALCKIDVQGAELMVLRGMERAIADIDIFVLEMALRADGGAPDFHALHSFMVERGFALHDIVGMLRRPYDGSLGIIDGVYVRQDSPLRASRRWS